MTTEALRKGLQELAQRCELQAEKAKKAATGRYSRLEAYERECAGFVREALARLEA